MLESGKAPSKGVDATKSDVAKDGKTGLLPSSAAKGTGGGSLLPSPAGRGAGGEGTAVTLIRLNVSQDAVEKKVFEGLLAKSGLNNNQNAYYAALNAPADKPNLPTFQLQGGGKGGPTAKVWPGNQTWQAILAARWSLAIPRQGPPDRTPRKLDSEEGRSQGGI